MEKALLFMEKKLLSPLTSLSEIPYLRATRDGLVSLLPLILIGSVFLMLGSVFDKDTPQVIRQLPIIRNLYEWFTSYSIIFIIPYKLTLGMLALFASFSIAYFLAKIYEIDPIGVALLSSASFLLTVIPQKGMIGEGTKPEWILPLGKLGGEGLFTAILLAFFSAEVWRLYKKQKFELKMPDGVPPAVTKAFNAIIPAGTVLFTIWILRHLLKLDLNAGILKILSPLEKVSDSLVGILAINFVIHLIWVAGIHGVSVVHAVFLPLWIKFLEENASAFSLGLPLPHLTPHPFYQWFVWVGGSGCTLSLVFLLLFSKSAHLRGIGKISFLPGICNINEPLIFGLPIMMNPVMAVPFIIAPMVAGTISYFAMAWGLVHKPYILVTWTLPSPIGGWLSTLDFRAVILFLIIFFITLVIYFPFVKYYEKKLLNEADPSNIKNNGETR